MSENSGKQRQTLVEEGTEFKGTMTSRCPVVVMGKVDGEIEAPSMHISASGSVAGTLVVEELRSEGELAGTVEADAVHLSGRVKDGTVIRAKSLDVKIARERGRMEMVFGECELEVGDQPSKEAAIEAATAPAEKVAEPIAAAAEADKPAEAKKPEKAAAEEGEKKEPEGKAGRRGRQRSESQSPPPA